ncbi:MAG: hypothetical protein VX741_10495, partial [Pseudomonadota bacterium]|nr:hypothetical protein [Pseudomonadota bacterium]
RKRWYAALDVPKDVQDQLGRRFFRSTKTDSRSAAAGIAAVWVAGWKQDIQRARKANGGILGPTEREATAWKSALENAKTDEERDSLHEGLLDKLDRKERQGQPRRPVERPPRITLRACLVAGD